MLETYSAPSNIMVSFVTMARVPFTLRIDEEERAALEDLSRIEGRPVNQLLNEAIKSFLSRRGSREQALETNLARLRAYRKRDPEFRQALAAFAESEASLDDPLEGEPVKMKRVNDKIETAGTLDRISSSSTGDLAAIFESIAGEVPDAEWQKVPADLSRNLDHYLYGAQKRS